MCREMQTLSFKAEARQLWGWGAQQVKGQQIYARERERERENLLNHGKWQGTHNNLSIDDAKWGLSKVVIEIVYIKIVDFQDFYVKGLSSLNMSLHFDWPILIEKYNIF